MADSPGPDGRAPATTPPDDDPALPHLPPRAPGVPPPPDAVRSSGPRKYRPESEREALLHRRANPWWRRMLRMLVLLVILGGLLTAGYFGIDALSDYVDRDRLPSPGVDSAEVRSASYRVQFGPAVGGLAGDITVDHASGTFRFQGAAGTDLAGVEIVGDAAGQLALRRDGGAWELGWSDPRDSRLVGLAMYLDVVDTDDVLTTTWRDGYVSIDDREKGVAFAGVDETTMYSMLFDGARYSTDHPFQWNEWIATVLPLPTAADDTVLTVWVDSDGVIRGFENAAAELRWERVTYSSDAVTIEFPLI
jgi:hypothetical protein